MSVFSNGQRLVNPPLPGQVETADELRQRFRVAGFVEGAPPQLDAETQTIDMTQVHRMRCPGCCKRVLFYEAWHKPTGEYRILAACGRCPAGEEI